MHLGGNKAVSKIEIYSIVDIRHIFQHPVNIPLGAYGKTVHQTWLEYSIDTGELQPHSSGIFLVAF